MNTIKNYDQKWSEISLSNRYTKLYMSNDGTEVRKHLPLNLVINFRQLVREINHKLYNEV
jgi:hypothetical protein